MVHEGTRHGTIAISDGACDSPLKQCEKKTQHVQRENCCSLVHQFYFFYSWSTRSTFYTLPQQHGLECCKQFQYV